MEIDSEIKTPYNSSYKKLAVQCLNEVLSMEILRTQPASDFGSPAEIIKEFVSRENYLQAIKELETELHKTT